MMDTVGYVSRHDRHQIEFHLFCPFAADGEKAGYQADIFFFFPQNLGINRVRYPQDKLYGDLQEYVRYTPPVPRGDDLAENFKTYAEHLDRAIVELPCHPDQYRDYLKLFTAQIRSVLCVSPFETGRPDPQTLDAYLRDAETILRQFRRRGRKLQLFPGDYEEFCLADEFLSLTYSRYCYSHWKRLQTYDGRSQEKAREKLVHAFRHEVMYRRRRKYPSVPVAGKENSELISRESALKKSISEVLFLKRDIRRDGVVKENLLLSLAAAIAMIFVTGIAFIWKGLFLNDFSLSFFVVWVLAYMFKDRIKALLQHYCLVRRDHYARYDYNSDIKNYEGCKIGTLRAGVRFRELSHLSSQVQNCRNLSVPRGSQPDFQTETVLHYQKKIELLPFRANRFYPPNSISGITDILRFNIDDWTAKMDNPTRRIGYVDGRNGMIPLKVHRDYCVNIVLRECGTRLPERYIRYRLIFNRNGIRRLEISE